MADTAVAKYGADPEGAKKAAGMLDAMWSSWAETGHRGGAYGPEFGSGHTAKRIQALASGDAPRDDYDRALLAQRDLTRATLEGDTVNVSRVETGDRAHLLSSKDTTAHDVRTDTAQSWTGSEHIGEVQQYWKRIGNARATVHDTVPVSSVWANSRVVPHLRNPRLMAPGEVVVAHPDGRLGGDTARVTDVKRDMKYGVVNRMVKEHPDVSRRVLTTLMGEDGLRYKAETPDTQRAVVELARKVNVDDPTLGRLGSSVRSIAGGFLYQELSGKTPSPTMREHAVKEWAHSKAALQRAGLSYEDVERLTEAITGHRPNLRRWDDELTATQRAIKTGIDNGAG